MEQEKSDDLETLHRLVKKLGVGRFLAALPQAETRRALNLVSVHELAEKLGLKYDTFRWWMIRGRIPFPSVRLLRRAYYSQEDADTIVAEWSHQESCRVRKGSPERGRK